MSSEQAPSNWQRWMKRQLALAGGVIASFIGIAILVIGVVVDSDIFTSRIDTIDTKVDIPPWESHPLAKLSWLVDEKARVKICRNEREAAVLPNTIAAHIRIGAQLGACDSNAGRLEFVCPPLTKLMCGPDLEFCATEPNWIKYLSLGEANDGACERFDYGGECPSERRFCHVGATPAETETVCGDPRIHRPPIHHNDCHGGCPECLFEGTCTVSRDSDGDCDIKAQTPTPSARAVAREVERARESNRRAKPNTEVREPELPPLAPRQRVRDWDFTVSTDPAYKSHSDSIPSYVVAVGGWSLAFIGGLLFGGAVVATVLPRRSDRSARRGRNNGSYSGSIMI